MAGGGRPGGTCQLSQLQSQFVGELVVTFSVFHALNYVNMNAYDSFRIVVK